MQLAEIIIEKIKKEGPISFRDFMEICLYYPGAGYYTSGTDKIGKNGDFYTTSNITAALGISLGKQFEEMWKITGGKEFTIVEFGAGTGMLCHDILSYLQNNRKFYDNLVYYIIEKSPAMRQKEKEHLPARVKWIGSLKDIPPVTGCIFSNELVDNFSVHKVVMEDELMEVFVDHQNGFAELLRPAAKAILNYLEQLNIVLPKGFRTEINLEATEWIMDIATHLKKGYVVTIDYGYSSAELYSDRRADGTLVCYHKHMMNDQPYHNIGLQDITSHVNFSALSHWGFKNGLAVSGFICQADFLSALGWEDHCKKLLSHATDRYLAFKQYAFLKYTLLVDMGQKLKVLIQQKAVPAKKLKGISAIPNRSFFKKKILPTTV